MLGFCFDGCRAILSGSVLLDLKKARSSSDDLAPNFVYKRFLSGAVLKNTRGEEASQEAIALIS